MIFYLTKNLLILGMKVGEMLGLTVIEDKILTTKSHNNLESNNIHYYDFFKVVPVRRTAP